MLCLGLTAASLTTTAIAALLISVSGVSRVIAQLIPLAAEIDALRLRGTGSGVIGYSDHFAISAALLALPISVSAILLARSGVGTRGPGLEEIQVRSS